MSEIVMPRLSDSMEEGTILQWLQPEGAEVSRGDPLIEIETDKATVTYEADANGRLAILALEGQTLPVGHVIGALLAPGEVAPRSKRVPEPPVAATATSASPDGPPAVSTINVGPVPAIDTDQPEQPSGQGRIGGRISPVAFRLATASGIDMAALTGTGRLGRIVKADVAAALTSGTSTRTGGPEAADQPVISARGATRIVELTRIQQVVARRMAEAKATVPEFVVERQVWMDQCQSLRAEMRIQRVDPLPSINDFVVKAVALALREAPRMNASYRDGTFEFHERINVGIAVAAEDALVVPTVFDADQKSLRELAADTSAVAERVRSGSVTPPELAGGTFTVSNLGMFGITRFTAVINPPQAAMLAVGATVPTPRVRDAEVIVGQAMNLSLTADHRVIYGADAAHFLKRVTELLERPLALLF